MIIHKDRLTEMYNTKTAADKIIIDGLYNFGKLAYARAPTGNYYALFDNKLAICYAAKRVTEISKWYMCPYCTDDHKIIK